ncbi:MAG: 50S ribosomal protein L1 [Candidatus Woesearchaeota archaeon]
MDQQQITETLQLAKINSKKRNFNQSIDLIINLKGINLKKPEENINTFIALPHPRGKESKIAALVGNQLSTKAKSVTDTIILQDNFKNYLQKQKEFKKLAKHIDFFIAQANLMPDIAKYFGKVLGPMGKMPNPKAGAIVPPITPDLKPIVDKLKRTVKLQTKNELTIKCSVGTESMSDKELSENILTVYNNVVHSVRDEKQNIKNSIIKLSMGKPFIIGKKYTEEELKPKEKPEKKQVKEKQVAKVPKEKPKKTEPKETKETQIPKEKTK